jgi:hypothetical protein
MDSGEQIFWKTEYKCLSVAWDWTGRFLVLGGYFSEPIVLDCTGCLEDGSSSKPGRLNLPVRIDEPFQAIRSLGFSQEHQLLYCVWYTGEVMARSFEDGTCGEWITLGNDNGLRLGVDVKQGRAVSSVSTLTTFLSC